MRQTSFGQVFTPACSERQVRIASRQNVKQASVIQVVRRDAGGWVHLPLYRPDWKFVSGYRLQSLQRDKSGGFR